MIIEHHLNEFYRENHIPQNGGSDDKTFQMKFGFISLTLPNPKFRREVTHIHDVHHVLNRCDTSWKGEGFIAGWEIATGIWKYFPVNLLSLWAMAYSLWLHPKSVYKGFLKGTEQLGVIDLDYSKQELLSMSLEDLKIRITKKQENSSFKIRSSFIFWVFISQVILFSPLLFAFLLYLLFYSLLLS